MIRLNVTNLNFIKCHSPEISYHFKKEVKNQSSLELICALKTLEEAVVSSSFKGKYLYRCNSEVKIDMGLRQVRLALKKNILFTCENKKSKLFNQFYNTISEYLTLFKQKKKIENTVYCLTKKNGLLELQKKSRNIHKLVIAIRKMFLSKKENSKKVSQTAAKHLVQIPPSPNPSMSSSNTLNVQSENSIPLTDATFHEALPPLQFISCNQQKVVLKILRSLEKASVDQNFLGRVGNCLIDATLKTLRIVHVATERQLLYLFSTFFKKVPKDLEHPNYEALGYFRTRKTLVQEKIKAIKWMETIISGKEIFFSKTNTVCDEAYIVGSLLDKLKSAVSEKNHNGNRIVFDACRKIRFDVYVGAIGSFNEDVNASLMSISKNMPENIKWRAIGRFITEHLKSPIYDGLGLKEKLISSPQAGLLITCPIWKLQAYSKLRSVLKFNSIHIVEEVLTKLNYIQLAVSSSCNNSCLLSAELYALKEIHETSLNCLLYLFLKINGITVKEEIIKIGRLLEYIIGLFNQLNDKKTNQKKNEAISILREYVLDIKNELVGGSRYLDRACLEID